MSKPNDDVWVVVPLFNEAPAIAEVIQGLLPFFPHVLCIDDGSTDGCGQVALTAGATLITHPLNLGQGAALQTGFEWILTTTQASFVVTFDADGQHRVEDAEAMVNYARSENVAWVLGSRFLGQQVEASFFRRFLLRGATRLTRWRTGKAVTDAHNGLRVIRRDALSRLHLDQNRMAHATQIIDQLAATDLPWAERPVHVRYTSYSKSKGQSLLNAVNIMVDLVMR